MAKRRVLDRLLRLRELEEELSRIELEVAVGQRDQVAHELAAAVDRHAQGRRGFAVGLGDPDTAGRTGAIVVMEQARRQRTRIEPRLQAAEGEVARQRAEFLARRTGRQQVETLLEEQQRETREEAIRRAQQVLDDWFGRRSRRPEQRIRKPGDAASAAGQTVKDCAPLDSKQAADPRISPDCTFPMKST